MQKSTQHPGKSDQSDQRSKSDNKSRTDQKEGTGIPRANKLPPSSGESGAKKG